MVIAEETYYVIEVNEGIYLTKYQFGGYGFTNDVKQAALYKHSDGDEAANIAIKCGGKVTEYLITHEVLRK
ncbi:hypothetical protein AABD41_15015 [Staphylococcus pseudoxylosus]|uniref:hypothetical protein n=1 Tax=Staphylococcus pseudoxylosus TaxID=2282419 RepID=UPI00398B56A7